MSTKLSLFEEQLVVIYGRQRLPTKPYLFGKPLSHKKKASITNPVFI